MTDPVDTRTKYAATRSGGVFRSRDDAASWHRASDGLGSIDVRALCIDPDDPRRLYAGTTSGVFVSDDGADSWIYASGRVGRQTVNTLVLDAGNLSTLYAGTGRGVYVSRDGGGTWTPASEGLLGRSSRIVVLVHDPSTGRLYAGTEDGVYRSEDGANSWVASNGQLDSQVDGLFEGVLAGERIFSLVIDADAALYAGTFDGVFRSPDGAQTWSRAGDVGTDREIAALVIDDAGQRLLVGTSGSLFATSFEPFTAVRESRIDPRPAALRLGAGFPNPFNGATAIGYDLPTGGLVDLSVFSVGGQRVRALVSGHRPPGAHVAVWDGDDERGRQLASGVYLYRLRVDDSVLARRLLLLR